jgi:hypothetical protein
MGWSVRWSIQGSTINFTDTPKTKPIVAVDLANLYPRTLQEHSTSLNGVPCAYFRVSLRDCAIHSSRCVDFADFGLVGLSFFVRLVKMLQAFVNKTTARLRCVLVFVKLGSVTYAAICCLPRMAIMCHQEKGSKDIFHHLLVENVHF